MPPGIRRDMNRFVLNSPLQLTLPETSNVQYLHTAQVSEPQAALPYAVAQRMWTDSHVVHVAVAPTTANLL